MATRQDASSLSRRGFLRAGAGAVAAGAATAAGTGGAAAQADQPFDGYLSDTSNFDGTVVDERGSGSVTIEVGTRGNGGDFAYAPPAVRIDPETEVTWEWTGNGGQHNVVDENGAFESDLVADTGYTFSRSFEETGTVKYFCQPHKTLGMKGVVVVGDVQVGGGGGGDGGGDGSVGGTETPRTTAVPDFGGYLDDVSNFDGTVADGTGQDAVTVDVGAPGNNGDFAFEPAAVHVDPGTTVTWEWTGNGGQHNVVDEDGAFESDLTAESGFTFEYTFEDAGMTTYYCQPHKSLGMKGAVLVGDDYPTRTVEVTPSGGEGAAGGGEGGPGGDGGDAGSTEPSAANETAANTLLAMLGLGFLSPVVFALLVRWQRPKGPST